MRKVLSFVLVLSLVLGSMGMAFAAPLSDVGGEDFEDAVNVLTELGVIDGYPDGTYRPDNIVTRGEMAKIIISALGLEEYAAGASGFSDMAGHWADKYVAYAVGLGIINGYPDGTFRPNNTVSYDEAAKMLVAALGYTEDALVGAWPTNWVTKAKVLGILDGIKAGSAGANRGDIALMTFQTLDVEMGKVDKNGNFVTTLESSKKSDTMLSRLGAELYDPDKGVTPSVTDPGDPFVIDDQADFAKGVNLKEYYGAYVTAYANSSNKIIAVKDVKSTFLTGKFDADVATNGNILANAEFGDYTVKSAVDSKDVKYIVNGLYDKTGGFTVAAKAADKNVEYKIAAEVSGTKIVNIYSISHWNIDHFAKVTAEELKELTAKKPGLLTAKFALNDLDKVDNSTYALVGVSSLDDIKAGNVVYVYKNVEGIARIEVGTDIVTGKVSRIKDNTYTVDGVGYKFGPKATATRPAVGDEVKAWLDYNGKIHVFDAIDAESNIAVILETGDLDEAGLHSKDALVSMFLADGTSDTFSVLKSKYADIDKALDQGGVAFTGDWVNAGLEGTVVEYTLNKDGKVVAMDIVAWDKGVANTIPVASEELTESGYFDGYKVAADALVISYEAGFSDDADDYAIVALKNLYGVILKNAYYTLNDDSEIDFLYIDSVTSTTDDVYAVVVGWEKNNSEYKFGVDLLIDGEDVYKDAVEEYSSDAVTGGAIDYTALYKVTYDSAGIAKLTVAGAAGKTIAIGAFSKVANNVITDTGAAKYTLSAGVVVYVWNADDEVYEVGSVNDFAVTKALSLFDTIDNGVGIYDLVLVK